MNDLAILQTVLTTKAITRADVIVFENWIKAQPNHLTAKDFVTKHHFAPGLYMREFHAPAGMIVVGRIHKYPSFFIIPKGKFRVTIDGELVTVAAPHIGQTPPGTKRALEILEDTIFITVHPTDKKSVAEVEQELVCDTEEEYQTFLESCACLLHQ